MAGDDTDGLTPFIPPSDDTDHTDLRRAVMVEERAVIGAALVWKYRRDDFNAKPSNASLDAYERAIDGLMHAVAVFMGDDQAPGPPSG